MSAAPVAGENATVPPGMPPAMPDDRWRRLGMWVFLVTDAMSFGAILLGAALLRARAEAWPVTAARLNLPLATAATLALVASSVTLLRGRLWATLALGAAFVGAQAFEYVALARHGVGFGTDQAASIFFVATGWHGLHVVAAGIALACVRRSASLFESAALFWQFVDAVWLVLFTTFYLAPAVGVAGAVVLGIAAAVGFLVIVFFAMNLRHERRAVRVVFVVPLVFPLLFTAVLVADALAPGLRP